MGWEPSVHSDGRNSFLPSKQPVCISNAVRVQEVTDGRMARRNLPRWAPSVPPSPSQSGAPCAYLRAAPSIPQRSYRIIRDTSGRPRVSGLNRSRLKPLTSTAGAEGQRSDLLRAGCSFSPTSDKPQKLGHDSRFQTHQTFPYNLSCPHQPLQAGPVFPCPPEPSVQPLPLPPPLT